MTPEQLAVRVRGHPATAGLHLLVLHGSRSRGDAGPSSDWDMAYLCDDPAFDPAGLAVALTTILGTDSVDVADLATSSALLRFRAARDGIALVEHGAGGFADFQLEATRFWCDAGPVIRAAHDEVLAGLG